MPINVQCPGCKSKFRAPDAAAGKRLKCPKCSALIMVGNAHQQQSAQDSAAGKGKLPVPSAILVKPTLLCEKIEDPSGVLLWAWLGGGAITLLLIAGLAWLLISRKPLPEEPLKEDAQVSTSMPPALTENRNLNQPTKVIIPPPPQSTEALTENQKLLAALVARANETDTNSKHFIYELALRYIPGDAEMLAKLGNIPGGIVLTDEERQQVGGAIDMILTEDPAQQVYYVKWPKPIDKMEITELQILLDKDLVGGLRYTNFNLQGVTAHIFVAKPKATVSQVLERYGKPSEERKTSLTYGSIRLIVDNGRVVAVVFPPRE
ncbi:MAG: hypothetical protein ABSG67_12210 [Thermoguttaceae bacterium]